MKTIQIKIEGMTCNGCVASAQRALENLPGVRSTSVDLQKGVATVQTEDAAVTPDTLIAAIEDAGYDAQPLPSA